MSAKEIAEARAKAASARGRLVDTAHEVQSRLKLPALADSALAGIKRKGEETARKRPVALAAAAGGLVAIVAAAPIARLVGRLKRGNKGVSHSKNGDSK